MSNNEPVMIGHANGIITIDLAETLDARREALRVSLGEPYRTMLGHFRHEIGHYYQKVLVQGDAAWDGVPRPVRRRARELPGRDRPPLQVRRARRMG